MKNFGGPVMGMNNDKDQMHPDDRRNLIVFIVLALMLFFAYDHFLMKPKLEAIRQAQVEAQKSAGSPDPAMGSGDSAQAPRSRDQIVTGARRIGIDNGAVFGTLPLTGNRIDDLQLKKYFTALGGSEHVPVLAPGGTTHPKFAELGWVADEDTVALPDKSTAWTVDGESVLAQGKPVTMTWSNGQGLVFSKTVSIDDQYVITVRQTVTNNSQKTVTLFPYGLIAGIGLPAEFSNQSIAHQGPIGYIGKELHEIRYKDLDSKGEHAFIANRGWTGITDKYWLAAIIPAQGEIMKYRYVSTATGNGQKRYQADIRGDARTIAPGASAESTISLFAGAKEIKVLDRYEQEHGIPHFDLTVDFGLWYFLTKPFFYLLSILGHATGNFGVGIIIFTIILRVLMFPLNNTSYRSFASLKRIAPQLTELRDKYGSDKPKLQQEMLALYTKEKVNPAAGCVPILLQIPVFFALYKVLSVTIEMRHAPFFGWIHDLSAMDPTTVFNLFGLINWQPPALLMIGAWPCMMLVAMLIQRQMNPPPQDPIQAKMFAVMPYLMTFIMAKFAAGLVIYWTVSNTLSVIQQYIIMRSMGVEVTFFHKPQAEKELAEKVKQGPAIHPEAVMVEDKVEEALFGSETEARQVSAPKPRRKQKKK